MLELAILLVTFRSEKKQHDYHKVAQFTGIGSSPAKRVHHKTKSTKAWTAQVPSFC